MREFRKKQKKLFKAMKSFVIFGAIFLFVFIGVEPYVKEWSIVVDTIMGYASDLIVITVLLLVFFYYSKYGKSDSFLNYVEHEISDAGYYYTSREENTLEDYSKAVFNDLKECNFSLETNIEIDGLEFDYRGIKRKEYFYTVNIDKLDKNDVLAYLDNTIFDLTAKILKRKGDAVLCFITDKADESAISVSKMITPLGKKEQLKIAIVIVEVSTKRAYFLGNMETKCKRLIVNHALNCELPLKEKFISKEKLAFQEDLEEHMKDFNITDFKNGNFYAH